FLMIKRFIAVLEDKGIHSSSWLKGDNNMGTGNMGDGNRGLYHGGIVYCNRTECPYISGRKSVPGMVADDWLVWKG
nr:hypothetical protein [Tanacetum cinerariifolium]